MSGPYGINETVARKILAQIEVADCDFHALPSSKVDALLRWAIWWGYRKPRNANGSRAQYFHAYLQRLAARE